MSKRDTYSAGAAITTPAGAGVVSFEFTGSATRRVAILRLEIGSAVAANQISAQRNSTLAVGASVAATPVAHDINAPAETALMRGFLVAPVAGVNIGNIWQPTVGLTKTTFINYGRGQMEAVLLDGATDTLTIINGSGGVIILSLSVVWQEY